MVAMGCVMLHSTTVFDVIVLRRLSPMQPVELRVHDHVMPVQSTLFDLIFNLGEALQEQRVCVGTRGVCTSKYVTTLKSAGYSDGLI